MEQAHALVEATCAEAVALERRRAELDATYETALRAADAERMIRAREERRALGPQLQAARCRWVAARVREARSRLDDLEQRIAAKRDDHAKAEEAVRASQLHIAQQRPGLNEAFLTGRTGILFGEGGPGVQELGERQRRANALQVELHALMCDRTNLGQEGLRLERELASALDGA